ncbi:hypothetical protein HYALB_00012570 [Hymenoscyphus albidus]|uniref:Uncharacterized protein n=1 Tax=Hymenoscyphus albidus TaxID=595503 RepID=A0A9N9PVK2_9HELO|nr:hypothetical protein HYALB_00012570 [Hymenoscyphus albidus]
MARNKALKPAQASETDTISKVTTGGENSSASFDRRYNDRVLPLATIRGIVNFVETLKLRYDMKIDRKLQRKLARAEKAAANVQYSPSSEIMDEFLADDHEKPTLWDLTFLAGKKSESMEAAYASSSCTISSATIIGDPPAGDSHVELSTTAEVKKKDDTPTIPIFNELEWTQEAIDKRIALSVSKTPEESRRHLKYWLHVVNTVLEDSSDEEDDETDPKYDWIHCWMLKIWVPKKFEIGCYYTTVIILAKVTCPQGLMGKYSKVADRLVGL